MDRKVRGSKLDHVGRLCPCLTHALKGYLAMLREVSSDRLASCPGGGLHLFATETGDKHRLYGPSWLKKNKLIIRFMIRRNIRLRLCDLLFLESVLYLFISLFIFKISLAF